MPAVLRNKDCPSCRGVHDLCDPNSSGHSLSGTYTFTCPATGKYVTLHLGAATVAIAECAPEALLLKRVTTLGA